MRIFYTEQVEVNEDKNVQLETGTGRGDALLCITHVNKQIN